jgi:hypothetical protein
MSIRSEFGGLSNTAVIQINIAIKQFIFLSEQKKEIERKSLNCLSREFEISSLRNTGK